MQNRYTEAFIEQALIKLYSRGDKTIKSVAEELNMNVYTLKNWLKTKTKIVDKMSISTIKERRPPGLECRISVTRITVVA